MRVRVCRADEVPSGELLGVTVDGLRDPVMVARVGGEIVAAGSICPHEEVSLLDGDLENGRVVCPGHGYSFDLSSGGCTHDPELRLRRFRVSIVDGDVWIDLLRP